jgi:hypothetical protein
MDYCAIHSCTCGFAKAVGWVIPKEEYSCSLFSEEQENNTNSAVENCKQRKNSSKLRESRKWKYNNEKKKLQEGFTKTTDNKAHHEKL